MIVKSSSCLSAFAEQRGVFVVLGGFLREAERKEGYVTGLFSRQVYSCLRSLKISDNEPSVVGVAAAVLVGSCACTLLPWWLVVGGWWWLSCKGRLSHPPSISSVRSFISFVIVQ